jgi:hypothetical protein
MNKQTTPKELDRLIEAGSNPARSTLIWVQVLSYNICKLLN